ncbi:MAG: OmpA family protein [Alphaproteobacteria bacterium]
MNLKHLTVVMAALTLAACQTPPKVEQAEHMHEQMAIPGSVEDFAQNTPNHVYFAYDKSDLNDRSKHDLLACVEWLKKYPHMAVVVEGHTDERGTREYNYALGERRAVAVKRFLAANGVGFHMRGHHGKDMKSDRHVRTVSFGKEKLPAGAAGGNEYTNQKNRVAILRVE